MKKYLIWIVLLLAGVAVFQACRTYHSHHFRSVYSDRNKLLHETENLKEKPYLKAHLENGDVLILGSDWQIDTIQDVVSGYGVRYDFNRSKVSEGQLLLAIDSVLIFETNQKLDEKSKRIAGLAIVTGIDVALGIFCLSNPKACFGSCPTFYINEHDDFHFSDAEGFSSAISPSMAYGDFDALNTTAPPTKDFPITMKNEALETHCVKQVKLYACPRLEDERVYQSRNNEFYLCKDNYELSKAVANEGDVTSQLNMADRNERFSLANPNNLKSKEEIHLTFNTVNQQEELGLVVRFRQTLMTTYFIYSALGYMGDEVSDVFAKIEQNPNAKEDLKKGIQKELGDIDVYSWDNKTRSWQFEGGFYETGPIAVNHQILPLKNAARNGTVKLKLVLNKGLWRIDHVGLTNIKNKVNPIEIKPRTVFNKNQKDHHALAKLNSPQAHLYSLPGDAFKLFFSIPEGNNNYELFLYSEGYYIEWMRENWLADKNLFRLKQMLDFPELYLRTEAKKYKQYEKTMETQFWNSKIETNTFSYYE